MNKQIQFYGKAWCVDCKRSKAFLDANHIRYNYIDIEKTPEAIEKIKRITDGLQKVPTILMPNGQVLVEPSNKALQEALQENNLI